jgi:hypothetical protein
VCGGIAFDDHEVSVFADLYGADAVLLAKIGGSIDPVVVVDATISVTSFI